jgi:type I restriction enzyme S subunit
MTELGPLPKEWRVVRLGEVFDILQGKSLSAKQNKGVRPRPFLRTSNVYWGYLDLSKLDVMDFTEEEEQKFALQYGDLLVCEGGDVGRTAMWEGQMQGVYYQNHLHRLRTRDNNVHPVFVMYWLQAAFTLLNLYSGLSNKTTIPNLSQGRLAAFPIPLPPLPEQRAIAHVLRTVQRAKEATEGVIAALKELKKSLMQHLFTYGPVPIDQTDQVRLKETEIGPLPEEWEVVSLGELFEIQQGKALSPRARTGGRKRPFLRTANVLWGRIDLGVLDEMHFDEEEEARLALVPGDLLVCEGGDIGRTAIWEGQLPLVLYQNHLHRLRPARAGVDPLFYMYWMQAAWLLLGLYGGAGNKTTIPNLSRSRLAAFPVPLPALPEQRAIAETLRTLDRKIEREESRKRALEALFKTLLHDLMTAKIRVKGFHLPELE